VRETPAEFLDFFAISYSFFAFSISFQPLI